MGRLKYLFASLCLVTLLLGCKTYKNDGKASSNMSSAKATNTVNKDAVNNNLSLVDHLRRVAGISIRGSSNNPVFSIRGMNQGNERPLFFLDGQNIGKDFSFVRTIVDPNNIRSVEVVKSASATVDYGLQGSGGVILIKSKKN